MAAVMALTVFAVGMLVFAMVASAVSFWSILPELDELRVECDQSWAQLERLLAERLVESGKLEELCRPLADGDPRKQTFTAVLASRRAFTSAEGIPARAIASRELSRAMGQFLAAAPPAGVPAVTGLIEAGARLQEIESQLDAWIEVYNQAVERWNKLPERLAGNLAVRVRSASPREPWRGAYEAEAVSS
jgi:hypothetical protein